MIKIDKFWICEDCGALSEKHDTVIHHSTCKPGDSEKWRKYYQEDEHDSE